MPNSTQEEKLRWIKPIIDGGITIKKMTLISPFSERALKYWLAKYRSLGLAGLMNRSTRPKAEPNETPIRVKEQIIKLRKDTNLSALKLHWKLKKEGTAIHPRTIGKIIKSENLTRRYRTRKTRYIPKKIKLLPGELIEIDIKYVPEKVEGQRLYQFTAIDSATRWRFIRVYNNQANHLAIQFLHELVESFPFTIKAVKTDNAAIFSNRYTGYLKSKDIFNPRLHPFDIECERLGIDHYLIDPGKPAQNGKVERSHRTDQEHFYAKINFKTIEELRYKMKLWNMYYNDLEHCSLNGQTPNEMLHQKVQNVRT